MTKQTQSFQAETKELLNLMIHSLYSHREIFLRELISNASDAIEKLRFEALTQPDLVPSQTQFEIRIQTSPELQTLSISDNGIGMTYDEVISHIGTIARSGTKAFLQLKQQLQSKPELIGQFGVGFYSAFMVADRVTLLTQKAGTQKGVQWESDGSGTYTIEEAFRPEGHGTTIVLHLKKFPEEENVQDFTDTWVIKEIVRKYSDFVAFPIKMKVTREKSVDGKTEKVEDDETLNSRQALWLKPSSEISSQEYSDFYRHISHDWTEPLKTIHYKAEGTTEFSSILYLPAQRPYDYEFRDRKAGLNLYVKRVFIKGNCEELLPPFLRFVKGVVDSEDLSLNVSRELLQQDRQIIRIKKALTSKVLSTLKDLLDTDRKTYEKFWDQFGITLKEGVVTDPAQQEKLQDLILFRSTHSNQYTTLNEYVGRMKPEQKAIYYITGESLAQVQNSPYLEKLKAKGFEVLLMTDRVDAWVSSHLNQYQDKPLQSVMTNELDLTANEEEKKAELEKLKEIESKLKPLIETMKETLKDQVKEIKLSDRLTESPACLVSEGRGTSAHMERLLESLGQPVPKNQRILEINPSHPLYEKLLNASKSQQEEIVEILYQQALLNEGSQIENPLLYSQKVAKLMLSALH